MPELSQALRNKWRSLVDRSPELMNPNQPDQVDAADIGGGWMVELRLSNQDKLALIRTAARIYGLKMPDDLDIMLPNAS